MSEDTPSEKYISEQDQAIAKVGEKTVRIVGSLSDTVANLLNDVYHDPEASLKKASTFSVEDDNEHDYSDVIDVVRDSISSDDRDAIIHVVKDEDISEDIDFIKEDAIMHGDDVYLITVDDENISDNHINRRALESYVLDYGGRVFRAKWG